MTTGLETGSTNGSVGVTTILSHGAENNTSFWNAMFEKESGPVDSVQDTTQTECFTPSTQTAIVRQIFLLLRRSGKKIRPWCWSLLSTTQYEAVAYPGILFGGGVSTNSVGDRGQRERGSGDGSPLVRGSGGSCNLVQEISFHIVKFS